MTIEYWLVDNKAKKEGGISMTVLKEYVDFLESARIVVSAEMERLVMADDMENAKRYEITRDVLAEEVEKYKKQLENTNQ